MTQDSPQLTSVEISIIVIDLEPRADYDLACKIKPQMMSALSSARHTQINGASVSQISTHMLQLLVSASLSFVHAHITFELKDPSPDLCDALADIGLKPDLSPIHTERVEAAQ